MTVAVLMTTYNRKSKTLACLASLQSQVLPPDVELKIFLTDDNSQDGTVAAVQNLFPDVNIFSGDGKFFWAGGMRFTWSKALEINPDYFLLLNDDTFLKADAIAKLLQTARDLYIPSIAVGSTADASSGKITYGGWKLYNRNRWKSSRVFNEFHPVDCDFANANILLVHKTIVKKLGILADHFTHSLADYDYTLKVKKAGYGLQVAPGVLGSCVDDHGNNWKSHKTSLRERITYLKSPKGLAYNEYLRFIKDHFPKSYPSAFLKLWLKTFFPFLWDRFKRQQTS